MTARSNIQDSRRATRLLARELVRTGRECARLREALEQTPQVVYDEIVAECGHTMAMAAAHAAKTKLRAALEPAPSRQAEGR